MKKENYVYKIINMYCKKKLFFLYQCTRGVNIVKHIKYIIFYLF